MNSDTSSKTPEIEDQVKLICRFQPDGILTFVNDVTCGYVGLPREQLLGTNFLRFIPEEDREWIRGEMQAVSLDHSYVIRKHRILLPSGELRWQQRINRALFDEWGRVVEFLSVGRDITEQCQARQRQSRIEALLRRERLLSTVASRLNERGDCPETGPELLALIGRSLELASVWLLRIGPGEELERHDSWSAAGLAGSAAVRLERPDLQGCLPALAHGACCEVSPVDSSAARSGDHPTRMGLAVPVRIPGRLLGCLCLYRESPAGWEDEERCFLDTLATLFAGAYQRMELVQTCLEAERKHLESIRQTRKTLRLAAVGEMSAGIVHQINQPLNAIRIIADTLVLWDEEEPGRIPAQFTKRLLSIAGCVEKIEEIIRGMRRAWQEASRHFQGECQLRQAVEDACALVERLIRAQGIEFHQQLDPQPLLIQADQVLLEQVLVNLLVNAVQALERSGRQEKLLRLTATRLGGQVRIEVQDNGIGLPAGADLFDPFFTTREDGEGTGLGLAIVRRFVERLEGQIQAWNNELGGATFVVTLPLVNQNPGEAQDADPAGR